ncbi:MAG TPA: hypothetical protein VF708_07625 [Pyrinomonadaceae bacterium]
MDEHNHHGTRQRVIACRKRMRRTRAMQRETGQAEVERPSAASDRAGLDENDADAVETMENLSPAGAVVPLQRRTLMSEVDRRPTLRAR